jgi:putative endonuclease
VIESVKQQPELKKKILTAKQKKLSNFSIGEKGEQLACNYLISKKYKIINTNIRVKNNEIDIVAHDIQENEIVFIEVKTRTNNTFGIPALAVTQKKLNSMNFVARNFLKQNNYRLDYRFDIISIYYFAKGTVQKADSQTKIEHFENVTW